MVLNPLLWFLYLFAIGSELVLTLLCESGVFTEEETSPTEPNAFTSKTKARTLFKLNFRVLANDL